MVETLSNTAIMWIFLSFTSFVVMMRALYDIFKIIEDSSYLEVRYANIHGNDKYDHRKFSSWCKRYWIKHIFVILLGGTVIFYAYLNFIA